MHQHERARTMKDLPLRHVNSTCRPIHPNTPRVTRPEAKSSKSTTHLENIQSCLRVEAGELVRGREEGRLVGMPCLLVYSCTLRWLEGGGKVDLETLCERVGELNEGVELVVVRPGLREREPVLAVGVLGLAECSDRS